MESLNDSSANVIGLRSKPQYMSPFHGQTFTHRARVFHSRNCSAFPEELASGDCRGTSPCEKSRFRKGDLSQEILLAFSRMWHSRFVLVLLLAENNAWEAESNMSAGKPREGEEKPDKSRRVGEAFSTS